MVYILTPLGWVPAEQLELLFDNDEEETDEYTTRNMGA